MVKTMADIQDLKEQSDAIANYDDRLRKISSEMVSLEFEKKNLTDKKVHAVWKLQDSIDLLSKS